MIRLLAFLLLVGTFLSTAEARQPAAIYRGSWQSQSTGHQGPMRLRLTQKTDGTYNARFSGRFLKVVPFTYKVSMTSVCEEGCQKTLVATKRIPIFGDFRTTANVSPTNLRAGYSAAKDRGTFTMKRVR